MNKKIVILGAGTWGTALAHLVAHNGYDVHLWCKEESVAESINRSHRNPLFLNTTVLPSCVTASTDIGTIAQNAHLIIEAIPIQFLRTVLTAVPFSYVSSAQWMVTSKGLEKDSGKNSVEILYDVYPALGSIVALTGPTFACELVQQIKTRCIIAGKSKGETEKIKPFFENTYVKLSYLSDMPGVLTCGAVKNIIALVLGMVDGAGHGKNTQAFMLTQAYHELKKLMIVVKGKRSTVDTLGGLGDLFLTASSSTSKNRSYGFLLGQGHTQKELTTLFSTPPEGVESALGLAYLLEQSNTHADNFFLLKHIPHLISGNMSLESYISTIFHLGLS